MAQPSKKAAHAAAPAAVTPPPSGKSSSAAKALRRAARKADASATAAAVMDAFFHSATVGMALLDEKMCYVAVNEALAGMNSLPVEAHIGRPVDEVVPWLAPLIKPAFERLMTSGGEAQAVEIVRPGAEKIDEERQWLARFFPADRDAVSGAIRRVGVIVHEITGDDQDERAMLHPREALLWQALNAARVGTWEWSLLTRKVTLSPGTEELIGIAPEIFDGTFEDFLLLIREEDREATQAAILRARDEQTDFDHTFRMRGGTDGSVRWIEVKGRFEYRFGGQPVRMTGTVAEVTARQEAQESLNRTVARQNVIQRVLPVVLYSSRPWEDDKALWVSESAERVIGFTPERFQQNPRFWAERVHPDDYERVAAECDAIAERGSISIEYRWLCGDGQYHWLLDQAAVLRDEHSGTPREVFGCWLDITERKKAEETIERRAYFDGLTDLPNRALFHNRAEQALATATRNETCVAVLFMDLDRFKDINDTLGHAAGDRLLQEVALRLCDDLRAGDTLARLSGDEFAMLLPNLDRPEDALPVTRRLLTSIAEPFILDGREIFVTGSVGISIYPSDGTDVDTLLRNADAAMYRAKHRGRNSYQHFTEAMNVAAFERLELESRLRYALEQEEMTLAFQPQVRLSDGRLVGVEALLRWSAASGLSGVPPIRLVRIAEETGLIVALGEWALRAACRQAAAWGKIGHPIRMSVNVSARQLRSPLFAKMLASAAAAAGLSPDLLDLEFTETMLMEEADDETEKTLYALRDLGVRLVLDDFGTGHLALSSLRRLPLDALKVDRIFIRDVRENPRDLALLSALTELAHALSLTVIAEGVETDPQRDLLREMGCDAYQGFLYCPPVAPAHVEALMSPEYEGDTVVVPGDAATPRRNRWAALGEIETAAAAAAERRGTLGVLVAAAHPLLRPQLPVRRRRPGSHRRPFGSSE